MKSTLAQKGVLYTVLIAVTLIIVFPLIIVLLTSFKSDAEFASGTMSLLPQQWNFDNYVKAMKVGDWGAYFKNSIIVTVFAVGGSLLFNSVAGYTFARLEFKGREILFIILLVGLMVPAQITVVPQFLILKAIPFFGGNDMFGHGGTGWLDTYYALIVPELSGSLGIFLARQYYRTFPKALDEAAYIDGCGYLKTYFRIYLPLSGPLIAALGIIKVVYVWNDFFHPLIYTTSESMRTIQLGLQVFQGQYAVQYNQLMAATIIVSLPLVICFILFQRQFISSMVTTGVKG